MSELSTRVNPREISDFIAALRHHTPGDRAALQAWKSSLLDRIADSTDDAETHAVADNARANLAALRSDDESDGGGR